MAFERVHSEKVPSGATMAHFEYDDEKQTRRIVFDVGAVPDVPPVVPTEPVKEKGYRPPWMWPEQEKE